MIVNHTLYLAHLSISVCIEEPRVRGEHSSLPTTHHANEEVHSCIAVQLFLYVRTRHSLIAATVISAALFVTLIALQPALWEQSGLPQFMAFGYIQGLIQSRLH